MSPSAASIWRANGGFATESTKEELSTGGQRHDRLTEINGSATTGPLPLDGPDGDDMDIEITAAQKMLSAMSGSLLTSLLVTPLDVVRVRLQSQPNPAPLVANQQLSAQSSHFLRNLPPNLGVTACCREVFFMNNNSEVCVAAPRLSNSPGGAGMECAAERAQKHSFNSTFDGLRKIARNEGFTTLWRGLSPTLVMTVPANIIYFTGYDWLRFNKQSPVNRAFSEAYSPLVAGAMARIVAAMVVSPIEMFRTRMQASTSTTSAGLVADTTKGIRDMVHIHGYRSLWRGLTLTLWRDVPFSGLYWWGYEAIRGQLTDARERARGRSLQIDGSRARARSRSRSREKHTEAFTDSFIAGALSGAVASIVTMPFDVGKTRQQVYKDASEPLANGAKKILAPEEQSMPRFLWHIMKQDGVAGLWRGWAPRTLKVAPACAIMISCYEVGKRMARSVNKKAERRERGD